MSGNEALFCTVQVHRQFALSFDVTNMSSVWLTLEEPCSDHVYLRLTLTTFVWSLLGVATASSRIFIVHNNISSITNVMFFFLILRLNAYLFG